METRIRARLARAIALLAATGCEQDQEPQHTGDYGTCIAGEVDELPLAIVIEGGIGGPQSEGDPLPEAGEDFLCCVTDTVTERQCTSEPTGEIVADEACTHVANSGWDPSDGQTWVMTTTCGPAWLDETCCFGTRWELGSEDWNDGVEGRPFLVDHRARVARPARRGDWQSTCSPAPVPVALMPAIVARWVRAGQAEHASVAAFARFSLVLMHHGAPATLVRDAHQAALDEVRHAALCFGLASTLGGETVGPGPLDVSAALDGELELARIVRTLVAEGCVGETLAALEAAEAGRRAADPVVRQVLAEIAEDETRHAALAWRTLSWLIEAHPALRAVADEALAAATAPQPAPERVEAPDLEVHGCLGPASRARVRRVGLDTIVLPLARELAESSRATAADGPRPLPPVTID